MDITPLVRSDQQIIQSYAGGKFKISGRTYETGVFVLTSQTMEWNIDKPFKALEVEDFTLLFEHADDLDVVLFGTGDKMQFFPQELRYGLRDKGLIVDAMDTGAACRTYNVLMAEGRRVAAVMMATES